MKSLPFPSLITLCRDEDCGFAAVGGLQVEAVGGEAAQVFGHGIDPPGIGNGESVEMSAQGTDGKHLVGHILGRAGVVGVAEVIYQPVYDDGFRLLLFLVAVYGDFTGFGVIGFFHFL